MTIHNNSDIVFRLPGSNRALVTKAEGNDGNPSSRDEAIRQLRERDAHVKAHEASHMGAPGVLAVGGPRYTYQIGPDGKPYAIGGQVTLSTIPARDPRSAEVQAMNLKKAALANGDPSPQDLAAASSADAMAREARNAALTYKNQEQQFPGVPAEDMSSINLFG